MSLDDLASWLFARTTGGIRWGLERTEELLAGVGDPHRRFHSLLIGGTNGKGSVAALCEAALRADAADGRRIGLYTSPHLISFSERIRVDGRPVADERLLDAAERLRPAIERSGASFFEAATAIAFLCFAEAEVELAVVEVGLGGRLDATNVLSPIATAVTNVARDHQEYLGESLAEIAAEKAGIFRAGVPALTGETEPEVLAVLRERAAHAGTELQPLDERVRAEEVRTGVEGTSVRFDSLRWGCETLWVPLPGAHQARNALLALELLGLLPPELWPARGSALRAFASVRWPGRLQVERIRGTTYLLDVAHNPAGVQVLAEALDTLELPRPRVVVAGILADKEWGAMLSQLLVRADAAILTIPPSAPASRRWDPEEVARSLAPSTIPIRVIPDLGAALQRASTLAPHGTVVVTGSIHTVGDAMRELDLQS